MTGRRQNFQTIAWFWDLFQRKLLNLDPPYQRRSVWNQAYRDYFIDTILLSYPAPAIFLYEEIDDAGKARYHVVDGKQRLTTIFDFITDQFPVSDQAQISIYRAKYFKDLDKEIRTTFYSYQFSVEYLPTDDESIINNIFDRINRNVAKLTPQELRHARFDGVFITSAENLSEWMVAILPENFPRMATKSRNQMKDVELTSQLLLLIEEGPKGYSQEELDKAVSDRDGEWNNRLAVEATFQDIVRLIKAIIDDPEGAVLTKLRLRNQADFYGLFGALNDMLKTGNKTVYADLGTVARNLENFLNTVTDEKRRPSSPDANKYYQSTRTASNLSMPRKERIDIVKKVILGEFEEVKSDDTTPEPESMSQ